jgi:hypothetical protein
MTEENNLAETPAPDAIAPETEVADSSPAADTPVEKPKEQDDPVRGVQKRIDELTWKVREAERREAAYLDALKFREPAKAQEPAPTEKARTLADFDFDETRFHQYVYEQAAKQAEEAVDRRFKEREEAQKVESRQRSFAEKEADFAKTDPEYMSLTRDPSLTFFNGPLLEELADSESGPAVAAYLARNRDIGFQISQLPPNKMAKEVGRIEARLETQKATPPKVSNAPPPTPSIKGETPAFTIKADSPESDKLSDAEWKARREKQLKRRS